MLPVLQSPSQMECVGRTLVRKSNWGSVVVVSLGDEQEIGRLLRESLCCFVVCFSYCMAGAAGCTPALNHTTYSHPLLKRLCPDHSSGVCTHCNSCCSIPPPLLSSLSLISGLLCLCVVRHVECTAQSNYLQPSFQVWEVGSGTIPFE